MPKVQLARLENFIRMAIMTLGMNPENACAFADVFMRATLRGVGHHDIYDLPWRLESLEAKSTNPNPNISQVNKYAGLEAYDGDNGPGELCCHFIITRGMAVAEEHGIGLCTIRNSNHFLAAAPYVQIAAEKGYLSLILTRCNPCMGMEGVNQRLIGNAPLGYASATDGDYPIILDICLAYASYGALRALAAEGKGVPSHWGADSSGQPSTNPEAIARGGVPYAVGVHKGFGLSLLVEILTGVLSGGQVIDESNPKYGKGAGVYSQTAIVIKSNGLMPMDEYRARVSDIINLLDSKSPGIHIPGQTSHEKRKRYETDGAIELTSELVDKLNTWAAKYDVNPL